MKIAFVGKGGSGKTTLAALFARASRRRVGGRSRCSPSTPTSTSTWPPRSARSEDEAVLLPALGDHLANQGVPARRATRGSRSAAAMVKTTPPGRGLAAAAGRRGQPALRRAGARGRRRAAGGHRPVRHRGPGRGLLPLQGRRGRAAAQPPGRRAGRVRGRGHDRGRGLVRLRAVHPVRRDVPGLRADRCAASACTGSTSATPATSACGCTWSATRSTTQSDVDFLRAHVGDDLLTWVGRSAFVQGGGARRRPARSSDWSRPTARRWTLIRPPSTACARTGRAYTRAGRRVPPAQRAPRGPTSKAGADLAAQIDPEFVLGPADSTEKEITMSLDVPTALLERAEAGQVDDAEFVDCVRHVAAVRLGGGRRRRRPAASDAGRVRRPRHPAAERGRARAAAARAGQRRHPRRRWSGTSA